MDFTWGLPDTGQLSLWMGVNRGHCAPGLQLIPSFSCLFLIFFGNLVLWAAVFCGKGCHNEGWGDRKKDEFHKLRSWGVSSAVIRQSWASCQGDWIKSYQRRRTRVGGEARSEMMWVLGKGSPVLTTAISGQIMTSMVLLAFLPGLFF